MSRFMVLHTLPVNDAEFIDGVKKDSEQLSQLPSGVAYHRTYCGFVDHKFFCDWEAPNKEALEQTFKTLGASFDVIYPVRLFDVAKMELEP